MPRAPSKTTRDVPLEVKMMPNEVRRTWMSAFRAALREKPQDMAALLAMEAVKKVWRQEGEEWIKALERQEGEEQRYGPIDPDEDEDEAGGGDDDEKGKKAKGKKKDDDEEEQEVIPRRMTTRRTSETLEEHGISADSIEITETLTLDSKGFRLTGDGYLVANPRVARTGIQVYKGWEVGRPDMDEVRVYRPENEVFSHAAMSSLAHRPITLDHPDTKVDATNWRKLAVGNTSGDVARDGDFVRVPLVLMDSAAILAAQSGTSQLSVGYGAKLIWGDGITPSGERFDAQQSEIRANHVALVRAARGGDRLKIGDRSARKGERNGQQRRTAMSDRMLTIDGVTIALEDKDGQILERHLAGLTKQIKDSGDEVATLEAKIEELEAALADVKKAASVKDGEIVELKKQVEDGKLTPAMLDKAMDERLEVVERAKAFFGDANYAHKGKTVEQIKREVATARHGEQKIKTLNDDAVHGVFMSLTEGEQQNDGFQRMTQSFSRPPVNTNDAAAKAYNARNERLANAWRRNKDAKNVNV